MKHVRLLLAILISLLGFHSLSAFPYFFFKKYQVEDGLSHNTVWCGLQDRYGFLWLGTSDGLNCFDGRGNKIYRNSLNEDYSLESNFVQTLFEDGDDIWVGTNAGLYLYERVSDRFTKFDKTTAYGVLISSEIKKVLKDAYGKLWIATIGQGLFVYDTHTGQLTQNSMHASFVWDLCIGNEGRIYAASIQEGLLCFDSQGKFIRSYQLPFMPDASVSYKINCLQNVNDEIWVGTDGNVLGRLNLAKDALEFYQANSELGAIRSILEYTSQELLVGTDNGLYLFDRDRHGFYRMDNPSDFRSLSDQTINAMMRDKEGTLWVMTNLGGVNYMPKETKRFEYYSPMMLPGMQSTGKVVGPFCEDENGNIWIGTRNGLCYFQTATGVLSRYRIGGNKDLKLDVRCLLLDGQKLWIGTYANGIFVIDLAQATYKHYVHSRGVPNTVCSNEVLAIYKNRGGDIFVGTSWGLCRYSPERDDFLTIAEIGSMISVVDIYEDMYNNMWIATSNNGVFCYNTVQRSWRHYLHKRGDMNTISSNSVNCLFEDMRGTMWFGTNGGGLCSFQPKDGTFVNFDPTNTILPNNVIYTIEQDPVGNFWISSNVGLIRVNPMIKDRYRQFTISDGLQGNQFSARSSLQASDGKLYFGGINGFNAFASDQFEDNGYIPPVYITDIRLPYRKEDEQIKQLLGKAPVYLKKRVELPYNCNSFSIRFVSLSYEDPSKNRYSYILKGVDKDWFTNSESNVAVYTNLSPGEYEFLVKGSNNDMKWNDKPCILKIVITPPWWRSSLAYTFYWVFLLALIYVIAWRWNLFVKKKYKRRMEDYQINKEKELYKSKISFFINLVHEIRTPLTLIALPLEKLQSTKREGKDGEYLSVIGKNVNYLLGITNQLLDFQKMETGVLQLSMKNTCINGLVEDVYNQFIASAELQGIQLELQLPVNQVASLMDSDKVRKIIVNLVGNALKYAQSRIVLGLQVSDDSFVISVSDDGPGIPLEYRHRIFDVFYQRPGDQVASKGTGIGLAFAKSLAEAHHGALTMEESVWGGSSFLLNLPLKQENVELETDVVITTQEAIEQTSIPNSKRFTVLLVEDNLDLLNMTRESLSVWYRVLKATNGQEALEIIEKDNVDVVVSDVMMPVMNGLELCAKLKSNLDYSHIPVILLTAKITLESKIEGLECGADVYLEKPFSIKQLHIQVENLLKLRFSYHKLMSTLSGSSDSMIQADLNISQKDCEFIARIQEVVKEQLADENFSIDLLAEQVHMSRSNFYRKIKALSGVSPNDYLKSLRMTRAAELIIQGARISEVAAQVGFSSSSYFAKCFKGQFGVLPKDYLESVRAQQADLNEEEKEKNNENG